MDMTKFWGIARHVLSGLGAGLVGFGIADSDTISQAMTQFDALVGAVVFLVGVGTSIYVKVKAKLD